MVTAVVSPTSRGVAFVLKVSPGPVGAGSARPPFGAGVSRPLIADTQAPRLGFLGTTRLGPLWLGGWEAYETPQGTGDSPQQVHSECPSFLRRPPTLLLRLSCPCGAESPPRPAERLRRKSHCYQATAALRPRIGSPGPLASLPPRSSKPQHVQLTGFIAGRPTSRPVPTPSAAPATHRCPGRARAPQLSSLVRPSVRWARRLPATNQIRFWFLTPPLGGRRLGL